MRSYSATVIKLKAEEQDSEKLSKEKAGGRNLGKEELYKMKAEMETRMEVKLILLIISGIALAGCSRDKAIFGIEVRSKLSPLFNLQNFYIQSKSDKRFSILFTSVLFHI